MCSSGCASTARSPPTKASSTTSAIWVSSTAPSSSATRSRRKSGAKPSTSSAKRSRRCSSASRQAPATSPRTSRRSPTHSVRRLRQRASGRRMTACASSSARRTASAKACCVPAPGRSHCRYVCERSACRPNWQRCRMWSLPSIPPPIQRWARPACGSSCPRPDGVTCASTMPSTSASIRSAPPRPRRSCSTTTTASSAAGRWR